MIRFIFRYGGAIFRIIIHLIGGWAMLVIVNYIPGIYVPIDLITILVSGFGGIIGTIVLVLLSFLGIYL